MPCRVVAKRRQKKVKNRPLFAFCAVLLTEQDNTQPALKTLLANGKIHTFQLLSQQLFHLSVHLRPYKRKPKSTLTAYEKEPHSDVLDRPVIGMWLFRFLIVCTAIFLVMLYARLSFEKAAARRSALASLARLRAEKYFCRCTCHRQKCFKLSLRLRAQTLRGFCCSLLVQRENFALGAGELLHGGGERVHIDERAAAGNENGHILLCGELAHDDLAAGAPV